MFLKMLIAMFLIFSSSFAYVKQYGTEKKGYKFADYSDEEQQSLAMGFMLETMLDIVITTKKQISVERGSGVGDYVAFVGIPKKMYEYNILDVKQKVTESNYDTLITTYDSLIQKMKSMEEAKSYSKEEIALLHEIRKLVKNNNECLLKKGDNCADNNVLLTVMKGGG